jgi:DNA modification methylase
MKNERIVPDFGVLYEGECLKVMEAWPDALFDCCITDPPYNMSKKKGLAWAFSSHVTMQENWDQFVGDAYSSFTLNWLREVCRVVKPNGNLLIFGSFHNIYLIGFILQEILERRLLQQITWFKPNAQPNITGRLLTESTEYIIWACNNNPTDAKKWTFNYEASKEMNQGKQLRNMWPIPVTPPSEKAFSGHPTQKPLALLERMVRLWTNPGDSVLDCFLGSGTTAVACEGNNRTWVGIEKDARYAAIARRRMRTIQKGLSFG